MQGATVETLKEASRVVAIAQASVNDVQFVFPGRWVDWEHIGVLTLTDASFCNEKGYTAGTNPFHSGRKRKGASVYRVYPLAFNSTTIKRVRKATLQAETYSLQAGLEAGDRIRALLCEMKGGITVANQWDDQSKALMPHLCVSDCRSLVDFLSTAKTWNRAGINKTVSVDRLPRPQCQRIA